MNAPDVLPRELSRTLGWRATLLVAAFCATLFGFNCFSGRPLSLHEARLPETSREMMATRDWVIPRSGGRPWLERPPLPHWCVVATSAVLGQRCDRVWVVRLPSAIAGLVTVLLTAAVAARLFGRQIGIVAGLALATSYEFYTYATLAEDDIYLGLLVTLATVIFAAMEFPQGERAARPSRWMLAAFFAAAGLTNLTKGPLLGPVMIGATAGVYLLWQWFSKDDRRAWLRYASWWGVLLFLAVSAAWPLAVVRRYPHVGANWIFDYSGTSQYDQPFWYYPLTMLGSLAPWTPAAIVGLVIVARRARLPEGRVERFVLCWAVAPIVLLSIPHRKHHHYLVPALPPWGVLAALGLQPIAAHMFRGKAWSRHPLFGLAVFGLPGAAAILLLHRHIPGPLPVTIGLAVLWLACVAGFYFGLHRRSGTWALGSFLVGLVAAACWAQAFVPDLVTDDTAFLRRVEATAPREEPLMVNGDLHGELDFFRNQFYLRPQAVLLHNLTFLRDESLRGVPEVYVVTRARDEAELRGMGEVTPILQSRYTRREEQRSKTNPAGERFTLFRLRFSPDFVRYPAPKPDSITSLQAMGREKGPYCGPPRPH